MATIGCKQFENFLEPWLAGDRHADAKAHLRDCPRCRALVEDVDAILLSARELKTEESKPSPRVWMALRSQLVQEGLLQEPRASAGGWLRHWFALLPRPALAGAYLAVLIAVAFAMSRPITKHFNDQRWLEGTQTSIEPASTQLAAVAKDSLVALHEPDPDVLASLHSNLDVVDNYIALCEKSVREDPQNEIARDYLFEAYQQKADLLSQISERGGALP